MIFVLIDCKFVFKVRRKKRGVEEEEKNIHHEYDF